MSSPSRYFAELSREEYWLKKHGFSHWPNLGELTEVVFNLQDTLERLEGKLKKMERSW
jgi:hypothetical protein